MGVFILFVFWIYFAFWNGLCLYRCPTLTTTKRVVIGIGLPRTGTSSLTKAMQMLGYNTFHFPLRFKEKEMLYRATKNCFVDWVTLGYRPFQLGSMFPGALFINTHRDLQGWLKSMRYLEKLLALCPKILTMFQKVFGPESNWHVFYSNYQKEIEQFAQTNEVLSINICKDAQWQPICKALDLPIPTKKFPRQKEFFLQLQQIFH